MNNVSVVLSTYNRPDALRLSLLSLLQQSHLPLQVIVADDGSTAETGSMVKELSHRPDIKSKFEILHRWQEDNGFRAARARNLAIAAAKSDYVICADGDLVFHPEFIADHLQFRSEGSFLQGHRVLLTEAKTKEVIEKQQTTMNYFADGIINRKNTLRNGVLARLFFTKSKKMSGIKSCNMSFWKKDLLQVNGFNEEFIGWGREDSELAVRLFNAGILRKNLRFAGLCYHLFHPEYSRKSLEKNDQLLETAIAKNLSYCEHGLRQHL